MPVGRRTITFIALGLAAIAGCRVGYDDIASGTKEGTGGSSGASVGGDTGQAGEASGGTNSSGGSGGAVTTGGSSSGGTIGGGGASEGGTSGSATGGAAGTSGASGSGGASGGGGGSGSGGSTGGAAGAGGCTPTNGGVEICDGLDNDCAGGVDDVTCPATCRGIAYQGNGYMFCDAELGAVDADASCTTLDMHLVKIDSAEENDFVASNMFGTNLNFIWLGGDDIATEGSWLWRDDALFWTGTSSGSAPTGVYTNWYPGYPGGNNTDCLEMRDDGTWDDKQCTQGKRYVCELSF